jgi:hypothetical protein
MTNALEQIITCRPVDWAVMDKVMPGTAETPVYPGSVKASCEDCGIEIWLGPRGQQYLAGQGAPGAMRELRAWLQGHDDILVLCFVCTAQRPAPGDDVGIVGLGNPYKKNE